MNQAQEKEVSFERDLVPIFRQFRASMMWRLDLTRYEDVRANASAIKSQIDQQGMPPPPYPLLTAEQQAMFQAWINQGYPR